MKYKREIFYTPFEKIEIKYTEFLGIYKDECRGPTFAYLLVQEDGKRDLYEYRIIFFAITITENISEKELVEIKEKIEKQKTQLEDIGQLLCETTSKEKYKKGPREEYPSYIG